MFSYQLPGGLTTHVNFANDTVKFEPPLYEQRYTTTMRILEDERWAEHFHKIVEFGCAEMQLFRLMRRLPAIEHIMEVDIDEDVLKRNVYRVAPLNMDFLSPRKRPLKVEIFKGNIMHSVEELRGADVVIGIEVIEHLYPDVLEKVPENVFGFIKPKLVIFSTPNRGYNVLFKSLRPGCFRIDDHKFEWTQEEFQAWAATICEKYKNYKVSFLGLGPPPEDRPHIGYCTQVAIFARLDILGEGLLEELEDSVATSDPNAQYQLIRAVDYPYDDRPPLTPQEEFIRELSCYILRNGYKENNFCSDDDSYHVSIGPLLKYAEETNISEAEARELIKNDGYWIDGDVLILHEYKAEDSYDELEKDSDHSSYSGSEVAPVYEYSEEEWS